MQYSTMKLC